MRTFRYGVVMGILALLASACSDGGAQQTLTAQNAALSTQINEVQTTATFQRDVLQVTLESVQLALTQVIDLNNEIKVTLQAVGIDPAALEQIRPNGIFEDPTATAPSPQQPINPNGGDIVATTPEAGGNGNAATPVVPTATPGQPTLYNMVMAEGVGSNDCALSSMTSFTSSDQKIYVVATAANIASGMTLGSDWLKDGNKLVSPSFTPDFDIAQNCIWFYVDQTDFPFDPGDYSVQLTINGTAVGQPIPFTITGQPSAEQTSNSP